MVNGLIGAEGVSKLEGFGASDLRDLEAGDLECEGPPEELWFRLEDVGKFSAAKSPDIAAAIAEPEPSRGRLLSPCDRGAAPALEGIEAMSN